MREIHAVLLVFHVAVGAVGLVLFWVPVVARKGGRLHVRAGRAFEACAIAVAISSIALAALDLGRPGVMHPDGAETLVRLRALFLAALAIATWASVRLATSIPRARVRPESLQRPGLALLLASALGSGLALAIVGLTTDEGFGVVLFALSPIGLFIGGRGLVLIARPASLRERWWADHLGFAIGGGIAFHTAFLVVGLNRFVDLRLTGAWGLVPWLAPTVIGVAAIVALQVRHARRGTFSRKPAS